MGRASSVKRLDPQARKFLEKLMRGDRHTLDELLTAVRTKCPDAQVSRSSIHRHRAGYEELVKGMREQQAIASLVVSELGENPDDKAGALLVQGLTGDYFNVMGLLIAALARTLREMGVTEALSEN